MAPSPSTDDQDAGPPPLAGAPVAIGRGAIKVLLVEDDDGDALLFDELLAEALPGTLIARTRTYADALERLDRTTDCIVLDLRLPDAEGLDTVVGIRARAPDTPLIVLTGLHEEGAGARAVRAGAQDFLVKGEVDGDQLSRSIRYAIGRRQAADAQQQLRLAEAQSREVTRLERGLAPRPLVEDPAIWIASRYRAGRNRALLGGDFFDAAEGPDGRLRVLVGDVCGHGPDEAAIGVCLRAAWRALAVAGADGEQAIRVLERVLDHERDIPHLFVTLCTLEIDPIAGSLGLMLAGHPAPILIQGGSVSLLKHDAAGPALGLLTGRFTPGWTEATQELPPGWAILLYTDGITEGRVGPGPERLDTVGLMGLISEHLASHPDWAERPERLLDELIARAEELNGGELSDDVAMLLVGSSAERTTAA